MKWDDATSYSRDKPRGKTPPRSWRARITDDVCIWVGSEHLYHEGQWVMHCRPWFETKQLGMSAAAFTAEQAQERALELVRAEVNKLHAALAA